MPDPPLLDEDDPPPLEDDPPPLDDEDPPPLEDDPPPLEDELMPLELPPELLVEVSQMGSSSAGAGEVELPQPMAMVHNAPSALAPIIEFCRAAFDFMRRYPFRDDGIRVCRC